MKTKEDIMNDAKLCAGEVAKCTREMQAYLTPDAWALVMQCMAGRGTGKLKTSMVFGVRDETHTWAAFHVDFSGDGGPNVIAMAASSVDDDVAVVQYENAPDSVKRILDEAQAVYASAMDKAATPEERAKMN